MTQKQMRAAWSKLTETQKLQVAAALVEVQRAL